MIAARSNFHLIAGFLIAALIVAGFSRSYYFRPWFDMPTLSVLLHLHAAAFTAWLALFIAQSRLASTRRLGLHRKLGILGGVIALAMLVTTYACVVEAIRGGGTIGGRPAWQFVAQSSVSITLFAGFVAAALALRRRPEWHKRFMLIATLGIIGPAVGRLLIMLFGVPAARHATTVLIVLLAACIAYDTFKFRRVHPAYVIGASVLLVAIPFKRALVASQSWSDFAHWVMAT
jgi:hypothetical protein